MALKLVVDNTKKEELKTYSVPITVEYSGEIVVKARNKREALEEAKWAHIRNKIDAIQGICVDVDFALGEDDENHITEVTEIEE